MSHQSFSTCLNAVRKYVFIGFLLLSLPSQASFIESTMGTAVVDDATATYYNPASLTSLKKTQLIALGSIGNSQSKFSGQSTQFISSYTQSGVSNPSVQYFLPSFYSGLPITKNFLVGLAVVANDFNRDIEGHSILRYSQSNDKIQGIDIVPAVGFKLNEFISIGAGLNRSHAHFLLQPISGIPSLNIPDSQSRNESWGNGWGEDVGLLLRPTIATIMGFNYRSAVTYGMKGKSIFYGPPSSTSNSYGFNYWTPARSTLSIYHFVTPQVGLVGTIQYIQWNIFKDVTVHDIATIIGVLPTSSAHYDFHNSWLITLGSNYRISSKWIIRGAGSYTQSPSNGKFTIDNGDSLTLGMSIGYTLFENTLLDCGYAHAFIQNRDVHVTSTQNAINGTNKGAGNSFALKLTVSV